ncbi:MAG: hypothetical protein WKF91_06270 [Segetibacter sp.]
MEPIDTMPTSVSSSSPVAQTERIVILDSLHGIAILGILLMNITGFGLPYVTVWDLSVLNEFKGPNLIAWLVIEGIFEGSLRALFSMLFGAGMILFISRLKYISAGKCGSYFLDWLIPIFSFGSLIYYLCMPFVVCCYLFLDACLQKAYLLLPAFVFY